MYKILLADKDTYITNRIIGNLPSGSSRVNANVGRAGTLDLFKLYGATYASGNVPNTELSRLLIHFDLQPLKDLVNAGKINMNRSSFNCTMILSDVYGGQTTPSNFDVSIFPLSRSFSEGEGKDVVYYSDYDVCNFMSSSYSDGSWVITGCASAGGPTEICDYITGSGAASFEKSVKFVTGEEDLSVDITNIVSATLSNILPDSGFRISFSQGHEQDEYSYFVKRFSSRSAYNVAKRPKVIVKYDDSIQDDTQVLRFDETSTIFLRNYSNTGLSNLLSGSLLTEVTGSNCLILKLTTVRSDGSGSYDLYFTGSQHYDGLNYFAGIYSASFLLNQADNILRSELIKSGVVEFVPVWSSLDGTVGYFTGSSVKVYPPNRTTQNVKFPAYTLSTTGLNTLHRSNEDVLVNLHIFDYMSPLITLVKRPVEWPSVVVKNAHYQVRDFLSNEAVIPFDKVYNSTKISSDSDVMYFNLDTSALPKDRSYVIDVMINFGGVEKIYQAVSNVFSVSDTQVM
jgi:hypothetical protein